MAESVFPSWALNKLDEYQFKDLLVDPEAISRFIKDYSELSAFLNEYPAEVTFFELREVSPGVAASVFGDPLTGLICSAKSVSLSWVHSNIYKLRSFCKGFEASLKDGNLLVAASCARGLFEQVASFNYYLTRIVQNREKGKQVGNMQRKNMRKGNAPPDGWQQKVIENLLNHIQICLRVFQGSDFDWSKFLMEKTTKKHQLVFTEKSASSGNTKKLHINDAIKSLPGNNDTNMGLYSALCDFVHPNIGSHWMVMDKRNPKTNDAFDTTLTDKPINHDAVGFFMVVLSSTLSPILKLAKQQITEGVSIANEYQAMAIGTQEAGQVRH